MGLNTDLTNLKAFQTSVANDGGLAAVQTDTQHAVNDLTAQVNALSGDLTTITNLKAALTTDGANATVLADVTAIITDLTAQLS